MMDSNQPTFIDTGYKSVMDEIEEAYKKGASDIEMCRILKIRPRDFESRYQSDRAFRDVVDLGRMMRRAYWMEQGRINMHNPKFNRNLWLDFMKNEFGWSDKSEVTTKEREKTKEELAVEIGPAIKKYLELQALRNGETPSE